MASKKESTFVNMTVTLAVITITASVALAGVFNLTKEKIEQAKKEKLQKAISLVVPEFNNDVGAESYEVACDGPDKLVFYPAKKDGKLVGVAVKTYTDKGFSGRFVIMVGFLPDGVIQNTAVLEHHETPGLGDKMDVSKSKFPVQFNGKNPESFKLKVKKDGGDVDAITAATISSRAYCDAIQRAYDAFVKEKNEGGLK
ncbi:MAG: RnfABCDGE type electron transport complex subunit G [Sphingobacteriales bacterium]|nr:RnfABCDGE type electron transport complex subunit G [Sphingobacteriales bacterium]